MPHHWPLKWKQDFLVLLQNIEITWVGNWIEKRKHCFFSYKINSYTDIIPFGEAQLPVFLFVASSFDKVANI